MATIPLRNAISVGAAVQIILKQDQKTGTLTDGLVKRILTPSNFHSHGIKVELSNGKIGRVQKLCDSNPTRVKRILGVLIKAEEQISRLKPICLYFL